MNSLPKLRIVSLLEVTGVYLIIYISIWLGQAARYRPPLLLAGVLLLAVCALSNRWHGDSLQRIGLAKQHLKPSAVLMAKLSILPLAVMLVLAARQPAPPLPKILFGVLGYPLWAFAQEYALLSFLANRLKDVLNNRPWLISFINGSLFSLVHFPNPVLLIFCFVGGTVFTRVFLKTPHLVPISLVHAAAGFLLAAIYGETVAVLKIGPAYLREVGLLVFP